MGSNELYDQGVSAPASGRRAAIACRPVEDVMTREVCTISPDASVEQARAAFERVAHLPVQDGSDLVGILARDDVRKADPSSPVSAWMRPSVLSISPRTWLIEAANLMRDHGVGSLVVMSNTRLMGIVTRSDLLDAGLAEAQVVGSRRCAGCGTYRHVRPNATTGALVCPDCGA